MQHTLLDSIIHQLQDEEKTYCPDDFSVDHDVRWCAGCGSYAILSQVKNILPELGLPKEKIAFVSGIGCSGRFTYYVDTYGFHGTHGRPIAIASGLKIARPDLSVWVATGDGDCLSIGGNHMIHAARRNVDLNVLLFNNEVYSLTKGQYSPTSKVGQVTKSSPLGVLDAPFYPPKLALGAGATFVARGYDRDAKKLKKLFERAQQHRGFSLVEVYTNCIIFNDGAFDSLTNRSSRKENTIWLEHGKPMVFGETENKGIRLDGLHPQVVSLEDGDFSIDDLLVHDETDETLAFILALMDEKPSKFPHAMGVFKAKRALTYEEKVDDQIYHEIDMKGEGDLDELLRGTDFWQV